MKLFLIAFAVIAVVAADVSHLPSNEYLPPGQEDAQVAGPTNEYLPPTQDFSSAPVQSAGFPSAPAPAPAPAPAHVLADDGYRYKTRRRVVYRRNRRDVSHLPENEYLPPAEEGYPEPAAPAEQYLAPEQESAPAESGHVLADDGYRYKTQRRVVYRRNRRDVSHLPENEYLPPAEEGSSVPAAPAEQYLAPEQESAPAEFGHVLADDGYRYKTQRRVVYRRNRRDVSHSPQNEYLPPGQESIPVEDTPIQEVSNAVAEDVAPAHDFADDGYRYKTHRRVVYRRNRRDVSHLPSNEYLPPGQDDTPVVDAPVQEAAFAPEPAPAHELADDGYRYKTQRRVVYRRTRRDVSHLPSNEYLPPNEEESVSPVVPSNEYLTPVQNDEPAPAHELSADGYRYKTQRRVVFRRH